MYILLGSPPLPPVLYIVKIPTTEIIIVRLKITQSKFEIIWYLKIGLLFIFITGALVTWCSGDLLCSSLSVFLQSGQQQSFHDRHAPLKLLQQSSDFHRVQRLQT